MIEKINYFLFQLQLKHWQEQNGFHHEVLGKYYSDLQGEFDKLVEVYISFYGDILITESLYVFINHIDMLGVYQVEINKFIAELRQEHNEIHAIVNILDDIASMVAQYTYLLQRK